MKLKKDKQGNDPVLGRGTLHRIQVCRGPRGIAYAYVKSYYRHILYHYCLYTDTLTADKEPHEASNAYLEVPTRGNVP